MSVIYTTDIPEAEDYAEQAMRDVWAQADYVSGVPCQDGGAQHAWRNFPAEPDVGIRYPYAECQDCGETRALLPY